MVNALYKSCFGLLYYGAVGSMYSSCNTFADSPCLVCQLGLNSLFPGRCFFILLNLFVSQFMFSLMFSSFFVFAGSNCLSCRVSLVLAMFNCLQIRTARLLWKLVPHSTSTARQPYLVVLFFVLFPPPGALNGT